MKIKERQWVQGPSFPCHIRGAACVALPPTMKYACIVLGGCVPEGISSNIYGCDRSLTTWKLLGEMKKGRMYHIVLQIS